MTKRFPTLALCCTLLACGGGGGGDHVNAATARSFSYDPALAATPPSSAADAVASLIGFQTAGDETSAVAAQGSLMATAFEVLPDDLGIGGFSATENPTGLVRDARSRTLTAALTGDPSQFSECTLAGHDANGITTVDFTDCRYTETTDDGTLTVAVDGTITGSPGKITWNVTYNVSMTSPEWTMSLGYHDVGDVGVDATSITAHQEADIGAAFSGGGQHAELGFAQSVDLDVTIDPTCATHVTDGTLEAKRVWTRRPAQASEVDTADRGVLFTWTGCGTANVQFSR